MALAVLALTLAGCGGGESPKTPAVQRALDAVERAHDAVDANEPEVREAAVLAAEEAVAAVAELIVDDPVRAGSLGVLMADLRQAVLTGQESAASIVLRQFRELLETIDERLAE